MVYKTTNLIKQAFESLDIQCPVIEDDDSSKITLPLPVPNAPYMEVHFISSSNDSNAVLVYLHQFISNTSKEKRNGLLELINEYNDEYRFIRFTLDSEGNISIQADISGKIDDSSVPGEAFDIFYQLYTAANECYPKIMKYLWS